MVYNQNKQQQQQTKTKTKKNNIKTKKKNKKNKQAASKVRKLLWKRMIEGMKRVFLNLRRMGFEPYVIKLQWAWRKRLFQRNECCRTIQCAWRRHVAVQLSKARRKNIYLNAKLFFSSIVLPPYVKRINAVVPIQRVWRKRLVTKKNAALYIWYGWWLPTSKYIDFRRSMVSE